jgi:hypothetical protein
MWFDLVALDVLPLRQAVAVTGLKLSNRNSSKRKEDGLLGAKKQVDVGRMRAGMFVVDVVYVVIVLRRRRRLR